MKAARSARLDALLVERGLVESRTRAQALVLAGLVRVGGEVAGKAGQKVAADAELCVEGGSRFVSRAGEKLDHALDAFGIGVEDRDCLDAGASTGGFTDVLLRRGAHRVLSVDVGYGQFDWRLRNDGRVTVMERTNVRRLSGEDLPFAPDLLVADLSFISLRVALENLLRTTPGMGEAVLLVKPQFEAGPESVSRGGLVREAGARAAAVRSVAEAFASLGFGAVGLTRSPVAGRKSGNREYPVHLLRGSATTLGEGEILSVVEEA
ncbi:TlyA family rRNA (cytidine-2'-O)-methyltransferase [Rubrobacter marinus]|uniref:TlyA family rRNA (Cytidine-2'-O)-methyltransferase n=1 Tax=Rubrobacter marinus TaxID=2653852 RepID=A0A6G8Q2T8_9ACTN|nr:TlyA family rRNA (cytidine-2'-O)-methyltransferase [Rubrobacter marinus]